MRKRIVITGMGAITPLGHSVEELFRAQLEGKSGVGPITLFDASGNDTGPGCENNSRLPTVSVRICL